MPTYRRRYRKKKNKVVPWYNKKYSAAQLAYKAWRATKYLKGLVNSEMFHHDLTGTLGSNQSQIYLLNGVAQGDDPSQRTGVSILMRNYYIRGYMEVNSSVTVATRVSMFIILDKQQHADAWPTLSDIFSSTTDPETNLELANAGRFKILYRKSFILTNADSNSPQRDFKVYKKCYKHVRFNGTQASDIQKNGIYLAFITSEGTNFPIISFNSRIGYHDN